MSLSAVLVIIGKENIDWKTAQREMLDTSEFLSRLQKLDFNSLQSKTIIKKLKECCPFSVEEVSAKNASAAYLLKWVKCIE